MAERAPFLNAAYGAYHHRERPADDEELTRVGPGTPCGEYLRRFWQPVILSEELRDLPRRLRIMGEDLVAFRDRRGAVGLLELHCPHRGTSLEFGLVSDKGIRCCYQGWLVDIDGTILETPGEPSDSTLKDRLFHGAYPVREYGGLVFAYMGPQDKKPDFRVLDTYDLPGYRMVARAPTVWECNWLQVKENSMDPAHLAFLHTLPGSQGFTEDLGALGEWDWMETPVGMVYIDTRRQGDRVWVRVADFIPPNIHQFPPNADPMAKRTVINRPAATTWAVPLRRYAHDADRLLPRARGPGTAARRGFRPGCEPDLRRPPTGARRLRRTGQHPWRHGPARPRTPRLDGSGRDDDAQHAPVEHPSGAGRRGPGASRHGEWRGGRDLCP